MNSPKLLVQAKDRRRYLAGTINFFLVGFATFESQKYIQHEFLNEHWAVLCFLVATIIFAILPESPGALCLRITVRKENKEKVSAPVKLARSSVLILSLASVPILSDSSSNPIMITRGIILVFGAAFYFINLISIWLGFEGISMVDRLTKTRVFQYPDFQTHPLKPY